MKEDISVQQVKDDPELLDLMMTDLSNASDFYKPTNFWLTYQNKLISELKSLGLRDFRRRESSFLDSISARDVDPYGRFLNTPKTTTSRILKMLLRASLKAKKIKFSLSHNMNKTRDGGSFDTNLDTYELVKSYGEKNGARPIYNFESSTVGNPENLFYVNNKKYTLSLLRFYAHYSYCCRFMNFDSIDTIMELGCGSGKQVEVIKKLHPDLCFYLFDIPPALYVCERYLSTLFPDSVVSYKETRLMKKAPEPEKGKIFIFANQKLPELANLKYDLFWNADSLDEMEPNLVANYLKYVNQQTKKYVFLYEVMKGVKKAKKKGQYGVLEQVKLEHYRRGLGDFHLQDLSAEFQVPKLLPWNSYRFTFWKRHK